MGWFSYVEQFLKFNTKSARPRLGGGGGGGGAEGHMLKSYVVKSSHVFEIGKFDIMGLTYSRKANK